MENKKAITACRIVAFMGILIGLLMFVFGIIVCTNSEIYYYGVKGIYDDSIKYGADYYTDSYKAMATTANNTYAIAQLMSSAVTGIGLAMIFGGLALMIGFIIKFASSYSVAKKERMGARYNLNYEATPRITDRGEMQNKWEANQEEFERLQWMLSTGKISIEEFEKRNRELFEERFSRQG